MLKENNFFLNLYPSIKEFIYVLGDVCKHPRGIHGNKLLVLLIIRWTYTLVLRGLFMYWERIVTPEKVYM